MYIKKLNLLALTATIACLMACEKSESAQLPAPPIAKTAAAKPPRQEAIAVTWIDVNQQTPSDSSPIGYWEEQLHYPEFTATKGQVNTDELNNAVKILVNQYKCDGPGDHTFTAEVEELTARTVKISYETMWMCLGMPSPDFTHGSVVFDISSGEQVKAVD